MNDDVVVGLQVTALVIGASAFDYLMILIAGWLPFPTWMEEPVAGLMTDADILMVSMGALLLMGMFAVILEWGWS